MMNFAHIINPVIVNRSSDLFTAQPITFETLEIAKQTGLPRSTVHFYIERFARLIKNPRSIDNESNLIRAYLAKYNEYGSKALARAEVARRIKLAKEIRKLREMIVESNRFVGL